MKFYQIVAFMMFFVAYTTMTFGSGQLDELFVPEDIFDLIDKFRSNDEDGFEKTDQKDKTRSFKLHNHFVLVKPTFINKVSYDEDCIFFSYQLIPRSYNIMKYGCLSLSDMKDRTFERDWFFEFLDNQDTKLEEVSSNFGRMVHKYGKQMTVEQMINKLVFKYRDNGNIVNFKFDENTQSLADIKKPNSTLSWYSSEGNVSINISEDSRTIVTCCDGNICKWEVKKTLKKEDKFSTIYPDLKIKFVQGVKGPSANVDNTSANVDNTPAKYGTRIFQVAKMITIAEIAIIFLKLCFNQVSTC